MQNYTWEATHAHRSRANMVFTNKRQTVRNDQRPHRQMRALHAATKHYRHDSRATRKQQDTNTLRTQKYKKRETYACLEDAGMWETRFELALTLQPCNVGRCDVYTYIYIYIYKYTCARHRQQRCMSHTCNQHKPHTLQTAHRHNL